ncbi:MAG: DUF559 domain-containing protein [Planctomycetes bacterium]|nr:DUF559 domain-containing protein [Planctomycetota bacterium]
MPLARLVENFDFSVTEFDVVIIDEASQCDVMGLLAFALAKEIVIVGDHEQVSPLAVGQKQSIIDGLIKLHLEGIPNSVLYDGLMSVYDLARTSFGGVICLHEHFRCVSDIIQFSNHLSYNGTIRPLRDDSSAPVTPHVIAHRVEATSREGKVNREEALVVASLVATAIETSDYDGHTFGVISLVGSEQAIEIERLLLQHLTPEDFDNRRIVCGNSAQFQGDERDVMFLSMVDTPTGTPLRLRQESRFQQRMNVAASRARNQMWVVYSLSPQTDLKPGDLRRRLIEHALDPKAVSRELEQKEELVESEFERQVMERLVLKRFQVTPQWRVGQYRIDLVVEDNRKRLAIECDGDRFHPIERLPDDMARQAVLERLGWTFIRLRGSEFFRAPDTTMERVFKKLRRMDIHPRADDTDVLESSSTSGVVDDVIRRAAEIRAEWVAEESTETPPVDNESSIAEDKTANDRSDRESVGEATETELLRYQEYHADMESAGLPPRALAEWLSRYREKVIED